MATILLPGVAVGAFAANSLLCRMALSEAHIDPRAFTAVRMLGGAVLLAGVLLWRAPPRTPVWDPIAVCALLIYAECFAWAYLELGAAAGALLLFAAVQITMTTSGLCRGERLNGAGWAGLVLCGAGLLAYLLPAAVPVSPLAATVMLAAGCAWGVYSLRGGRHEPIAATAWNFILAAPLACLVALPGGFDTRATAEGIVLAVASGAFASGLGYVIWYRAVSSLSAIGAATAQLSVPLVAALGGVIVLGESLSGRLVAVTITVLLGVVLVNAGVFKTSASLVRR